jgi:hypothetical protein
MHSDSLARVDKVEIYWIRVRLNNQPKVSVRTGLVSARSLFLSIGYLMPNLYRFEWSLRGGEVAGLFVATPEELQAAIGKQLYFGEILGKHSEVSGDLGALDVTLLTDDQEFIQKASELKIVPFGYNPLDAVQSHCEEHGTNFHEYDGCDECRWERERDYASERGDGLDIE